MFELNQIFDKIRAELLDEYNQSHSTPWVIGYSGGKDSTLVAHLVMDMLVDMPKSERRRDVWIVGMIRKWKVTRGRPPQRVDGKNPERC